MKRRCAGLLAVLTFLTVRLAVAGEGGGSHYMPGMQGDFAMALIGPPGFYLRNDVAYFQGSIGSVTLGDRVYSQASQDVWIDSVKLIYLAEGGVLGARLGVVATVPVVIDATARGAVVSPFAGERSGSRSGFADVTLTSFLNWDLGESHVSAGLNVYAPAGSYDENRIINLGRNYWSFDPVATYTWLQPERGHEVSVTTGFLFNTTNGATDYSSGTEWHLDFLLGQHFSEEIAIAAEGAVLQGISDDSGALLDQANALLPQLGLQPLGGFRASYVGLGPAVLASPTILGKKLNFIAKYLFDVTHENRFDSDYLVLSAAFSF